MSTISSPVRRSGRNTSVPPSPSAAAAAAPDGASSQIKSDSRGPSRTSSRINAHQHTTEAQLIQPTESSVTVVSSDPSLVQRPSAVSSTFSGLADLTQAKAKKIKMSGSDSGDEFDAAADMEEGEHEPKLEVSKHNTNTGPGFTFVCLLIICCSLLTLFLVLLGLSCVVSNLSVPHQTS